MPSPFWLYRTGFNCRCSGAHVIFTETWLTHDPPVSFIDTQTGVLRCAARLGGVFGGFGNETLFYSHPMWEQLLPKPNVKNIPLDDDLASLNPHAPEAAFRLQRVGASGKLGLIRVPITSDLSFTDRPHRRHVDVATLRPLMNANLGVTPQVMTWNTRTYYNVIFNRVDRTWDFVDHYELRESTCRVWNRTRFFSHGDAIAARLWDLPEPDNNQYGT